MATDSLKIDTPNAAAPGLAPYDQFPHTMRASGGLNRIRTHGNSTTETEIWKSKVFTADQLNVALNFMLNLFGHISSGGSDDVTIDFNVVPVGGSAVTICTLTTVSLANEDDKGYTIVIGGKVTVAGASGKVFATGKMEIAQATPLYVYGTAAGADAAGVSVDLSAGAYFQLTADWDGADATSTISAAGALFPNSALPEA